MLSDQNAEAINNVNETIDVMELWDAFETVNKTVEENMEAIGNSYNINDKLIYLQPSNGNKTKLYSHFFNILCNSS